VDSVDIFTLWSSAVCGVGGALGAIDVFWSVESKGRAKAQWKSGVQVRIFIAFAAPVDIGSVWLPYLAVPMVGQLFYDVSLYRLCGVAPIRRIGWATKIDIFTVYV